MVPKNERKSRILEHSRMLLGSFGDHSGTLWESLFELGVILEDPRIQNRDFRKIRFRGSHCLFLESFRAILGSCGKFVYVFSER